MSSRVAIVTFEDTESADKVLHELEQMEKEKLVDVSDAATAVRDENGHLKISETTDFSTGRGAATGGLLGLVIGIVIGGPIVGLLLGAGAGALLGKKVDLGISKDRIDAVADSMHNSSSAIFVQIDSDKNRALLRGLMEKYDGTLHEVDLSDEHEAAIGDALEGTDLRH